MTITRAKAVKLLGASEQRFYEASRRGAVNDHGATRLKKLIAGARNSRDKARGRLLEIERRDNGGRGKSTATPENSRLKLEVFEDILQRFEAALTRAEARSEPNKPAPRTAAGKVAQRRAARQVATEPRKAPKKKATGRTAAKKTTKKAVRKTAAAKSAARKTAKKSTRATSVAARARAEQAPTGAARGRKKPQAASRTRVAHSAARGRRQQAKRDRR